mgnify:CR=1 FL=1
MNKENYTMLPCGEPAIDISDTSGYTFYVGKTCSNFFGSQECEYCTKLKNKSNETND